MNTPSSHHGRIITALEVRIIQLGAIAFWCIYWIMNAIDKVAAGSPYWAGKVRYEKMLGYWTSINLGEPWIVTSSLVLIGIMELVAGLLMLGALYYFIRAHGDRVHRLFFWGTATGVLIFSGFITFDVIVGDRMELWEHTTYWMAIIVSWLVYVSSVKLLKED